MVLPDPSGQLFIEQAFWILVGRAPSALEARDELRGFDPHRRRLLVMRLLSSPEFAAMHRAWKDGRPLADPAGHERGLRTLGPYDAFVQASYECLLDRPADAGGLTHYAAALAAGDSRASVLRSLALSEEFARHYLEIAPQNGRVPRDVQLCELANPAKWDNPDWLAILRDLGLSDDRQAMHRKPYEFTQLVYGCRRLGVLRDDASIVSVGAGHELVLYWLANHARRVVATDMYEGAWQDVQGREGDPDVVRRPDEYAPFPYRREGLVFMRMDGRHLAFHDGVFDIAYSLSSIEHFGGLHGAGATVREMGRVVKRGGIVALATEYVLGGPPHDETFQPHEFVELISQPGLELVEPVDERVYRRYECEPIDLYKNPYQSPHMVVRFNETVFTTVMVFLRKL